MLMPYKYKLLLFLSLTIIMLIITGSTYAGNKNSGYTKKQIYRNGKQYNISINNEDKFKVNDKIINNIIKNHPEAENVIIYEINNK